jgi:alpha-beta hydrolase superfamily lysophospholipase
MLRWLAALFVTMIVLGAGAFALFTHHGHTVQPALPGAFYRVSQPVGNGAQQGRLLRMQRVTGLPLGEKGWRILYMTRGYDDKPAVVSGLVIVSLGRAPEQRRNVVVWAHGTTGVAQRCGPSVLGGAAASGIDGLSRFIRAGDAVFAPDYQGLGTPGPHPFLLGPAAARTVIDGVRAAGQIPGAHSGVAYAVFGESQGGQAALSVAQIARRYGSDLRLVGVAAAAPPTKLDELFSHVQGTAAGNILTAFALSSWAKIYDDARLDKVVRKVARPVVRSIDRYCIQNHQQLQSVVPHALALKVAFLHTDPTKSKVWSRLLKSNSLKPFATDTPLLIVQGASDPIVSPGVTTAFVRTLCDIPDKVDYQVYPGVNHVTIAEQSAPSVAGWIADRFAGRTVPSSCPR